MTQSTIDIISKITRERDLVKGERDTFKNSLIRNKSFLQRANTQRDENRSELETVQADLKDLQLKYKRSVERITTLNEKYRKANEKMAAQLRLQEEQFNEKRSSRAENQSSSSQRQSTMANRDPFSTPTANSSMSARRVAFNLPEAKNFGPSLTAPGHRQQLHATYGSMSSFRDALPYQPVNTTMDNWAGHIVTEPGSPQLHKTQGDSSKALTIFSPTDFKSQASEHTDSIRRIFALVEGWVTTYTTKANKDSDCKIPKDNAPLWKYMTSLTYPNQHDAQNHTIMLVSTSEWRPWLVMRMMVDYVARRVWVIGCFEGFDAATGVSLTLAKQRLDVKGYSSLLLCS